MDSKRAAKRSTSRIKKETKSLKKKIMSNTYRGMFKTVDRRSNYFLI